MHSRDIVRKAWQMTQVHLKKLIWYGAIPAFFSIVVTSGYLTYQYNAFRHSELFSDKTDSNVLPFLKFLWQIMSGHPWATVIVVILFIIFALGYVLIPPILHGTMISAVMRIKEFKPIQGSFELGLRRFFPMFEFGILTGSFSITTLFTEGSFTMRWWGVNVFFVILPILLFVAMVGLILSFLFTYSEYYIVLYDKNIIQAMKESALLVITNLRKTIIVFILMLLIGARVILNVLLVLLIPLFIIALSTYFAGFVSSWIGITLIALFSLVMLLISSYLLGLFRIFATAVWVLTFAILTSKEEEEVSPPAITPPPQAQASASV